MAKAAAKASKKKTFKKKEKKNVPMGVVHVQATFNNTIVTITDPGGQYDVLVERGSLGFRGSRKGTPFAAQQAALTAANKAKEAGCGWWKCGWRAGFGPRIGRPRAVHGGHRSAGHQGRDADSAQRLPAAEEAPSLIS